MASRVVQQGLAASVIGKIGISGLSEACSRERDEEPTIRSCRRGRMVGGERASGPREQCGLDIGKGVGSHENLEKYRVRRGVSTPHQMPVVNRDHSTGAFGRYGGTCGQRARRSGQRSARSFNTGCRPSLLVTQTTHSTQPAIFARLLFGRVTRDCD